jgi:hypothetical protein
LAWIKEKERRAQVETRSKKKKHTFCAFFDEIERSIEFLEKFIADLMKGMFLFRITFG